MSLKHPKKKFFFNLRKRWLKFIPTKRKIIQTKQLRFIAHRLHDRRLWRFDHHSVPIACGIGVFLSFMPIPFQMIVSIIIGIFARANLLLCVVLVWISNPVTLGPILYFSYRIGKWILGSPEVDFPKQLDAGDLFHQLHLVWQPLILGCFVCGIIAGVGVYLILKIYFMFYTIHLKRKHAKKLMHSHKSDKTKK